MVGSAVALGKRCRVQDVYGLKVVAGRGAEAEKMVAEKTEIHDGCTIGQVIYTRRLKNSQGRRHTRRPCRKSRLPSSISVVSRGRRRKEEVRVYLCVCARERVSFC
ncbi:MAG TPA: hypothetical protein VHA09_08790 [Nitrososphaera sp.]|nr:hypothetical protein [Nitrososphaera sp.]